MLLRRSQVDQLRVRAGMEGVEAAFDEVCARFPELPRPAPLREAAE